MSPEVRSGAGIAVMNAKKIWSILKGTAREFGEDNVLRLSAALAYYAMFSIGPLLVIAVGVAGLVFGHHTVQQQIAQQIQRMLGPNAANTLVSMMSAQRYGSSLITTILGIIALLFGASGVFGQIQDSLNTIWEVKSKPGAGIWGYIRSRFLSFAMVLGVGFLLLVSLALTTFITAMTGSFGSKLPISETLAHILNFVISFAVVSALFALIFKYLPDVKIPFKKVWVGGIGTALLFTIGKYLLAWYLGRQSTTSSYGAAGSVIVILMWVYYASVILFFGAEFTQVYVKQTGTRVVPSEYAVPVTQEARAQEGIPHQEQTAKPEPNLEPPSRRPQRHPQPAWPAPQFSSPGTVATQTPWRFVTLMLVAGFAGGVLLRFKSLRKVVRLYTAGVKS